jgi:hypothetical protein
MDTLRAFGMGEANRGNEPMVFDWDKAARRIKESGADNASAGLSGDWEWTGGSILENGKPDNDSYTYLSSTWATPELSIDNVREDCYKMKSETDGWDAGTKWPDSALKILNGK